MVPYGMQVDSLGNIYVADSVRDRIIYMDNQGLAISIIGNTGVRDGQFRNPTDVAIDSNGYLYTVESIGFRVQKFITPNIGSVETLVKETVEEKIEEVISIAYACGKEQSSYNRIIGSVEDDVIMGTELDDLIFALDGNDVIFGGVGNDCIIGGEGDDVIFGNEGNDNLSGGGGNDVIKGQSGDDIILGGNDIDIIDGGAGIDLCYIDDNTEDLIQCESWFNLVEIQLHKPGI